MIKKSLIFILCAFFLCLFAVPAMTSNTQYQYPIKIKGHPGGDITPSQALKMVKENNRTFIVDVRSIPEFVLVGHPVMAYHVPIKFWNGKHTSKEYGMKMNENFLKDLKDRFNIETDTLIFMCRSGKRSCLAAELAINRGWPKDKAYNMMGGFEGDKLKNENSIFNGQRAMGGWKNEGLPWTYKVDSKLAYSESH